MMTISVISSRLLQARFDRKSFFTRWSEQWGGKQ